jgi:thiol-disulfide isomerase/thioredoxin
MNTYKFTTTSLITLAVYQLLLGLLLLIIPAELMLKFFGVISIILGLVTLLTYKNFDNHWSFYLNLFSFKIISLFYLAITFGRELSNPPLIFIFIFELITVSIVFNTFVSIYDLVFNESDFSEDASEVLKKVRTNKGEKIAELSLEKPILLIFVRHFGCTFCRETVSEVSKLESLIKEKGHNLVFVHMSDPSFGDEFFSKYFENKVSHISDPNRTLYRAFGLKRGSLNQLFGIKTWWRGVIAGIFKGHGIGQLEGDGLQLGGAFVISGGKIQKARPAKNASEEFNLDLLLNS